MTVSSSRSGALGSVPKEPPSPKEVVEAILRHQAANRAAHSAKTELDAMIRAIPIGIYRLDEGNVLCIEIDGLGPDGKGAKVRELK